MSTRKMPDSSSDGGGGGGVKRAKPRYADDILPPEMWHRVFSVLGCQTNDADCVAGTCREFKALREDPYGCSCDLSSLIQQVLLYKDRHAMAHVLRVHGSSLPGRLLGELCLSVGDLACPPLGHAEPVGRFASDTAGRSMLNQACIEGRPAIIRELLGSGIAPELSTVLLACERLDRYDDDISLVTLLECGSEGEDDILSELSAVEDSAEEEEDAHCPAAAALARILSGAMLPTAMRDAGYTRSFVYLLSADPRFARTRYNFCAALSACIAPEKCDRVSAQHLFERCGMRVEWVQREQMALMAQHNWHALLELVLRQFPWYAREAAERAVIAGNVDSVRVALRCLCDTVPRAELATGLVQLCAACGDDELMAAVVEALVLHHEDPAGVLRHCTRRGWSKAVHAVLKHAGERCGDVLSEHTSHYVRWAVSSDNAEALGVLARLEALGVCRMAQDDVILIARYIRRRPKGTTRALSSAMGELRHLFGRLTQDAEGKR